MKWILMFVILAFSVFRLYGQTDADIEAVMRLTGTLSREELDEDELERFMELIRRPLRINDTSSAELLASGLFTSYQTKSLEDYSNRHGGVYSLTELASVDGFSEHHVRILGPFIDLSLPEQRHKCKKVFHYDMDMKSSVKKVRGEELRWSYSLRGKMKWNERLDAAFSVSRPYDAPCFHPTLYPMSMSWKHSSGKVVVGDFNARFGQGLCLWNTVSFSTLSTPSSFMKRPSGISSSYSFTGTYAMTGIAADFSAGPWLMSTAVAFPEIKKNPADWTYIQPVFNLARYFRFGHVSATHSMHLSDFTDRDFRIPEMKTSADLSMCFCGVNLFSEAAYDWVHDSMALVAGMESAIGEDWTMACLMRHLPLDDEHGVAMGCEYERRSHHGAFSADLIYRPDKDEGPTYCPLQLKTQFKWRWNMTECIYTEIRITERYRSWERRCRTDFRMDVGFDDEVWFACMRINLLKCDGTGIAGYVDAGYRMGNMLKLYFRQGVFSVDDWDDRIYVYERDAPGNFNVPALYGRGIWSSCYAQLKFADWCRVYLRGSYTAYPLMHEKKKPGRAELKFQLSLHF